MPAAVLMYHGVERPLDPANLRYTVSEAELREHVGVLARGDVLAPADLHRATSRNGVVLTFDDGEASVLSLAAPILAERELPAILFMTSGFLGQSGYLDAAGLRELDDLGFTVGAHGATHRFLNTLPIRELDEELAGARKKLEDVVGRPVTDLSLPGGRGGRAVTERARAAGYDTIYTSIPGWNGPRMDRLAIRRTAVRRGMSLELVQRLMRCDPVAHARDVAKMSSRGLIRKLVGEDRYHRFTSLIFSALERR
ncbi:MAG: polysaccharide deacetylase family protein [Deltaproteobacteria bacterium]|nr:polysaccharide deacetylase family protein [Deltaproteobacteria bacterium]